MRRQAEFEAAYRRTGDPSVLGDAFRNVWWSRQTVPGWLVVQIGNALVEQRTDAVARRHKERMRTVRRYICVRNLRRRGGTKDAALERAVTLLADEPAHGKRETIERDHDDVRMDLQDTGARANSSASSHCSIRG